MTVFKHYDKTSKWAFAAYMMILVIHVVIVVIAILTLDSAGEARDWGGYLQPSLVCSF